MKQKQKKEPSTTGKKEKLRPRWGPTWRGLQSTVKNCCQHFGKSNTVKVVMVGGPKNHNKKSRNAAESGATSFGHDLFWPVSPTWPRSIVGILEGEEGWRGVGRWARNFGPSTLRGFHPFGPPPFLPPPHRKISFFSSLVVLTREEIMIY